MMLSRFSFEEKEMPLLIMVWELNTIDLVLCLLRKKVIRCKDETRN